MKSYKEGMASGNILFKDWLVNHINRLFLSSEDIAVLNYQGRIVVIYVETVRSYLNKFKYGSQKCSNKKFHEIIKYEESDLTG